MDGSALIWITAAWFVALAMEPWAAWVHRVVWHGPLWSVHESHHVEREGLFEVNDGFALVHALPAMVLIIGGSLRGDDLIANLVFGVGIGMTVFGAAYALVHDGVVHERLPVARLLRWRWFRRIRGAHRRHHLTGGYPYGLFDGPTELKRAVRRGAADS
ncbi:MAG: sterol desaturase family protein [Proteobacteria bacterium]|nr:sterol desaturase family protein [Pseudomonadota bacterium]